MKRSQLSVILSLFAVFGSGIAVGALGYHRYSTATVSAVVKPAPKPGPDEWRRKYVEELRTRLQLDEAQITRLNGILDETRHKMKLAKDRLKNESDQIKTEHTEAVKAMLSPNQVPGYLEFRAERERAAKEQAAKDQAAKQQAAKAGN